MKLYNPSSPLFEPLWQFLEAEIKAGHVISPEEVYVELKPKALEEAPAFAEFIKRVKGTLFVAPSSSVQGRFTIVVNGYPDLTRKGKPFAKSDADAWVIALAEEVGAVVVTQERPKPSAVPPRKIPDVAAARGLTSVELHDFLNALQGLSANPAFTAAPATIAPGAPAAPAVAPAPAAPSGATPPAPDDDEEPS